LQTKAAVLESCAQKVYEVPLSESTSLHQHLSVDGQFSWVDGVWQSRFFPQWVTD